MFQDWFCKLRACFILSLHNTQHVSCCLCLGFFVWVLPGRSSSRIQIKRPHQALSIPWLGLQELWALYLEESPQFFGFKETALEAAVLAVFGFLFYKVLEDNFGVANG